MEKKYELQFMGVKKVYAEGKLNEVEEAFVVEP